MFYFLFAALGLFAYHHAKTTTAAQSVPALPWSPPVSIKPFMTKKRDTSVTKFPVDVWIWNVVNNALTQVNTYVLAVASDDSSSWVAYMVSGPTKQKILAAKGTGPLTAQIQAQV